MSFQPTDEQIAIIESALARSIVTASAGAGKTGVIVSHYCRLVLEDGLQPDQILAITFTRKAAAEMKTRIVNQLRAAGRPDLAQIAETGPIQTIHGFCQRLLKENSLFAGLDPEFDIADEGQKRRWQEEALRGALAQNFEEAPEIEVTLRELAGRRANEAGLASLSPYGQIEGALRKLLGEMRGSGHTRESISAAHGSAEAVMRTWRRGLIAKLPDEVKAEIDPDLREEEFWPALVAIYKRLRIATPTHVKMVTDRDPKDAVITSGLVQLACGAWRMLERRMREENALDFTLLEEEAIRALEDEAVRRRCGEQYRVALIDEAQDLNPLQYKLIENLAVDRVMLVGDRQQSIYAFRQADVELFITAEGVHPNMRLTKNHRSVGGILRFIDAVFAPVWPDNYRPMAPAPEPRIEGNVIELFGPEPELPEFTDIELWPMELADASDIGRRIGELVGDLPEGLSARDICVLVRDSAFGERLFRELGRHRVPAKLVGVSKQYYTRMEVRDMANALRALADPYDDFALAATLTSPFGGLSYDALTLLAQHKPIRDNLNPMLLPAGDAEKLTRFLEWYEPLSRQADRLTAGEAVSALLSETPLLETLARRPNAQQLLANVRKLQRIACSADEVGPMEFAEQIRETQTLRHDESDEPTQDEDSDAVSIMTIHRSKGLEFEVVVVPQTIQRIGRVRDEDVRFDPRVGLAAASFGTPKSRYFMWLQDLRRQRETDEDWRVMYVALTRAKRRLCVVARPTGANTFADAIAKNTGFKTGTPPGVRLRE